MSGRDMRNFITTHRADEAGKLVSRLKQGIHSNKYHETDYEALKLLAAQKKAEGSKNLQKFQKFKQVSKQSKENSILRKHKSAWQGSWSRLLYTLAHTEADATDSLTHMLAVDILQQDAQSLISENSSLQRQQLQFVQNTVAPVNDLIDDLKAWVRDSKSAPISAESSEVTDVMSTIDSVRDQQDNLLDQLMDQQCNLEKELSDDTLMELVNPSHRQTSSLATGIPIEAFNMECPDNNLKASILQQFILLDESYLDKLECLHKSHANAVFDETGGWILADHEVFLTAMSVYSSNITGHRSLCLDYLKRHLVEKDRQDLVEHEEWWQQLEFYKKRRRDLLRDWSRDRAELLNRVAVTFNEATLAAELSEVKQQYREQQEDICEQLYQQVHEWRLNKLEAQKIQQNIAARAAEHQRWVDDQEAKKEQSKRLQTKQKISHYHERLADEKRKKDEADKLRLEALTELLEEQASYDVKRVEFRDEQQRLKEEGKRLKEEHRQEELMEKERQLELLREKVRPHVEGDMLRILSDTKSWKQRLNGEEQIEINQPLYDITSYTDKQITSDPRFRLEQKLRDAGLVDTEYARKIISKYPAPKPQRRDMESTLFKNDPL